MVVTKLLRFLGLVAEEEEPAPAPRKEYPVVYSPLEQLRFQLGYTPDEVVQDVADSLRKER